MSEQDQRGQYGGQPTPDLSSSWAHGPYDRPTGPATWTPPLVQRKKRSKRPYLVAGAAVLAVLLVVGGVLFFRGDPIRLDGRDVADPEGVLADADDVLAGYAEERSGVTGDDSRCWFELTGPDSDEVRDALVCGPVLLVDGDPDRSWLRLPVSAETDGDQVRLTVDSPADDAELEERPDADLLRRPDGGTPPEGSGGLEVPPPPQAEAGWVVGGPFTDVSWTAPAAPARLSGAAVSVTITGLAEPERVGEGQSARRAADGERLVAVQYLIAGGEGASTATPAVSYQVDDADPLVVDPALVVPGATLEAVLSVPEDVEAADLVVDDAGVQQRLSLLTGQPGPGNLQVVNRANRGVDLNAVQPLTAFLSGPGRAPAPVDLTVAVTRARLFWFAGADGSKRPADPSRAWLVLDTSMAAPNSPAGPLPVEFLSLALPDGSVVRAVDLDDDPVNTQPGFDVPGDFTAGTVTVTGMLVYPDAAITDFGPARMDVPVGIAAG